MFKKILLDKISSTKNVIFVLLELQLITFFLSIHDSYLSGIFRSCSAITMEPAALKRQNFFQNENKRKVTKSFAPRPLIFKLQQDVLRLGNVCVSWSSRKTDLETNF